MDGDSGPFLQEGVRYLGALLTVHGNDLAFVWWNYRVDRLEDAGGYRREVTADADEFQRFDLAFGWAFRDRWLALSRACDKDELTDELEASILAALEELTA